MTQKQNTRVHDKKNDRETVLRRVLQQHGTTLHETVRHALCPYCCGMMEKQRFRQRSGPVTQGLCTLLNSIHKSCNAKEKILLHQGTDMCIVKTGALFYGVISALRATSQRDAHTVRRHCQMGPPSAFEGTRQC